MTLFWTILDIPLNVFCIDIELLITINFLINQLGFEFNEYISDFIYHYHSRLYRKFLIVDDGQLPSNEYNCTISAILA